MAVEEKEQLIRDYFTLLDAAPNKVRWLVNEHPMSISIFDAFCLADMDFDGWCYDVGVEPWHHLLREK